MTTQTAKHTPGPWTYRPIDNGSGDRFYAIHAATEPQHGAPVIARVPAYMVEDARLIAAAPGLLENLAWIVEYVLEHEADFVPDGASAEAWWLQQARAAIRLATEGER